MQDQTHLLMDQHDWWRHVEEETHGALTGTVHLLPDEAARTLEYLALLYYPTGRACAPISALDTLVHAG